MRNFPIQKSGTKRKGLITSPELSSEIRGVAFSAPPPISNRESRESLQPYLPQQCFVFMSFCFEEFHLLFCFTVLSIKGKKVECTEMNVVIYNSSVSFVFMSFCFEVFYSCYFVLLKVCCSEKGKCTCLVQGEKSCIFSFT